jgi:Protein of unknown function (DUF4238)
LKRRRANLFWLAHSIVASGDFGAGLVELGFDFIGQLKLILKIIVNPLADLLNFLSRQVWDRRLDFFDRAHANNLAQSFPMRREKPWPSILTRACQLGNGLETKVHSELQDMHWTFMAVPEGEPELLISDYPVMLSESGPEDEHPGPLGLRNPNIELVMPLSRRMVAVARRDGPESFGELVKGSADS